MTTKYLAWASNDCKNEHFEEDTYEEILAKMADWFFREEEDGSYDFFFSSISEVIVQGEHDVTPDTLRSSPTYIRLKEKREAMKLRNAERAREAELRELARLKEKYENPF